MKKASKGVIVKLNPKVKEQVKPKGKKLFSSSAAPKKALPQAKYGMSMGGAKPKYQPDGPIRRKPNLPPVDDPNKYVMNKTNIFGKHKHDVISKEKYNKLSERYTKQKNSKTLGTNDSMGQQFISGRNPKKSVSRIDLVKKEKWN
jgi:hypothetical protein